MVCQAKTIRVTFKMIKMIYLFYRHKSPTVIRAVGGQHCFGEHLLIFDLILILCEPQTSRTHKLKARVSHPSSDLLFSFFNHVRKIHVWAVSVVVLRQKQDSQGS